MNDKTLVSETVKLVEAWRVAHAAAREASDAAFSGTPIQRDDTELAVARTISGAARAVAREVYDAAASEAEKRIRAIEAEAYEAQRAVLLAHAADLKRDNEIVAQARKALTQANDQADLISAKARDVVRDRLRTIAAEARRNERAALVALVLAVGGGPVVAEPTFKFGARRDFDFHRRGGIRLNYRLNNRRGGSLPYVHLTANFDVPTPTSRTGTTRLTVGTDLIDGETLQDAIRNAEDAAIAEGWLVRPAQE